MAASYAACVAVLALCAYSATAESAVAVGSQLRGSARVRYDLWHGEQPVRRTMILLVAAGTPFYDVMLLAANKSRAYRFEAEVVDGATYVNSIGGRHKDEGQKKHWMFYKLDSAPQPSTPPEDQQLTAKGINDVFISDGDIYLFWLKYVTWA